MSRSGVRAHSLFLRRVSADITATTRLERSPRSVARLWASPKRTSGSAPRLWSRPSILNESQCGMKSPNLLIEKPCVIPGAVEIGYTGEQRWTVGLQEQPAADGQPGMVLDKNSVFLITGAAGSIVSAITADLAAASGGTFYLLDLVPKPDPDNPDLKRFVADKRTSSVTCSRASRTAASEPLRRSSKKNSRALERAQAAQTAIDAVRAAGGTPHYFSVNLADAEAVAKVIERGASAQRAHRRAAACRRYGTKPLSAGQRSDRNSIWSSTSRATASSICCMPSARCRSVRRWCSARLPAASATSARRTTALPTICCAKSPRVFVPRRPATRGIAIDWTAWGGIGMATRGSIPKIMELAGIDMLPPEAGIPLIRRELTAGATRGEIVIAPALGVLLNEWDATGGLDTAAQNLLENACRASGPMVGKVASMSLYERLHDRNDAGSASSTLPS